MLQRSIGLGSFGDEFLLDVWCEIMPGTLEAPAGGGGDAVICTGRRQLNIAAAPEMPLPRRARLPCTRRREGETSFSQNLRLPVATPVEEESLTVYFAGKPDLRAVADRARQVDPEPPPDTPPVEAVPAMQNLWLFFVADRTSAHPTGFFAADGELRRGRRRGGDVDFDGELNGRRRETTDGRLRLRVDGHRDSAARPWLPPPPNEAAAAAACGYNGNNRYCDANADADRRAGPAGRRVGGV